MNKKKLTEAFGQVAEAMEILEEIKSEGEESYEKDSKGNCNA